MKSSAFLSNFISIAVIGGLLAQTLPAADSHALSSGLDLLVQKARSLELRDRQDLAAQVWQQVLLANPNQPDALAGLAHWAKRNGKKDEVNIYMERLRRVSPDASALAQMDQPDPGRNGNARLDQANKLAARGQYMEAMTIFREAFGSSPPPGGWAVAYYETMANTPDGFEPAIRALKKLASDNPGVPAYALSAGRLMTYRPATRREGVAILSAIAGPTVIGSKARDAWRQALVWEQSNPAYTPEMQTYLSRYTDPELQQATAALRTHSPATQSSGSPEEQLGYRALKTGDIQDAEKRFNAALSKDKDNGRAHAGLGFAHMKAGDFDAAVSELELARKESPNDVTIRSSLESAKFWQAMHQGAKASDERDWATATARYRVAISQRPNDTDAILALGGALLAAGLPDQAVPYLSKGVKLQPSVLSAWCGLAKATLQTKGGAQTLALMHSAPETSVAALNRRVGWKAIESKANLDAGNGDQALKIYREITGLGNSDLDADEQIELATLALGLHLPDEALTYARKVVETAPEKPGAWELFVSALVASKRVREADRVYSRMPAQAQQIAMSHAAFRETLASLKESSGDLEAARRLLEESVSTTKDTTNEADRTSLRLHLGQVLARLDRGDEAETMVAALTESHPDNPDVWRAYFSILQTLGRDADIVSAVSRVPQPVMSRLTSECDTTALLARAYASVGDPQAGIKMLETYVAHPAPSDSSGGLPERIQLGWLLLDSPGGSARLYSLLENLNGRKNLTPEQQQEVARLWTTWILRSAEAARMAGNPTRALALLERGNRMFPHNKEIQRGFAGSLMSAGLTKRALNVYANWGLSDAQVDDYAGAIGAAQTEHNNQYADAWLNEALTQWPTNPKILTLAGERAQARGELERAKVLWKEALVQQQAQSDTQAMPTSSGASSSLKSLLVGSNSAQRPLSPAGSIRLAGLEPPDSPFGESKPDLHLATYHRNAGPVEDFVRTKPLGDGEALSLLSGREIKPKSLFPTAQTADSLEDKIAALESRNTPYLGSGMSVLGRGGESGFSRLIIQQPTFEASATLQNALRASLLLQPTYLSSGAGTGDSDSLFGRQTTPASFAAQNASGIAAEAQLSSNSIGVRIGSTPQGFLTHSWIGGIRVQPVSGPITLLLERDSVKDTMLSYAGARDSVSHQIWGGVMANSASMQARWGNDRSGFYVNGAYQVLEGRNVARNTGINANLGSWWKVTSVQTGNLTIGMNFSAMHYDRNLRYFTFGQGGYFSPQQYFLFSVPVGWSGYYGRRLQYVIAGALGSQHFVEDESDYYPSDSALQARTNHTYPSFSSTGANFNFDARLNYQLTPHYLLGVFATANNARNYTAGGVGLFIKYTFEERPMSLSDAMPSLPDWRGRQPFLIQ